MMVSRACISFVDGDEDVAAPGQHTVPGMEYFVHL